VILTFQRAIYGKVSYVYGGKLYYQLANYPFHFYVEMLAWVFIVAVLMFIGALLVFGRLEGNFAEEL